MKKIITLALALIMCMTLFCSCNTDPGDWDYLEAKGTMIIGYTLYEPMNYKDADGKLVGFDTEFAEALCAELGLKPEFVEINWDSKETELNAKNLDAIWNGFTVDEERKTQFAFSKSYVSNKQVVVIKKANADKYTDLASLANAKCAAESGLDGVVCSPLEAGKVHDTCGKSFVTVTPGVRFADGDKGDQVRVMTPEEAKKIGSDYIVVGRPITAAEDPVAAYERCVKEFVG